MNITKEYINECDCPEVQGLKPKLEIGDYIEDKGKVYLLTLFKELAGDYLEVYGKSLDGDKPFYKQAWERRLLIWLPTSGQLDEEIVKLNYGDNYIVDYHIRGVCEVSIYFDTAMVYIHRVRHANPLIAKIKLLKELLKESEE